MVCSGEGRFNVEEFVESSEEFVVERGSTIGHGSLRSSMMLPDIL